MFTFTRTMRTSSLLFVLISSIGAINNPASANSAAAENSAKVDAMRVKFENAPNYAAFIHDGMQRPTEGGRFYALLAYHRCAELATVDLGLKPKAGTRLDARARAVKKLGDLKMRCSGVKQQFPDDMTLMRALKASNARGTPDVLLIEQSALASTSHGSGLDHLQRAKNSGDRYLLAATLEMSVEDVAESIDPSYGQGRNRSTLFMAASAAACEIVGNCRESLGLLIPCVSGETCKFDDYRDFLRAGLPVQSRSLFDKTRKALLQRVGRVPVNY